MTTESLGQLTPQEIEAAIWELGGERLKTNASAVRAHLGRGSNQTIQKVLNRLKEQLLEASRIREVDDLPVMPLEEMQAVWRAAATAALRNSFERLARLQIERDEALEKLVFVAESLDAANAQIDLLREASLQASAQAIEAAERSAQTFEQIQQSSQAVLQESENQRADLQVIAESMRSEIAEMKTAIELERSQFATERVTLERMNERQMSQLVELRGWVYQMSAKHSHPSEVTHVDGLGE